MGWLFWRSGTLGDGCWRSPEVGGCAAQVGLGLGLEVLSYHVIKVIRVC